MNKYFPFCIALLNLVIFFLSCSSCAVKPTSSILTLENFQFEKSIPLEVAKGQNVNGIFPEQVYIKTLTQTFSRDYQFCLQNGLIYYKSMPDAKYFNPGIEENFWQPVNGVGLPYSSKDKNFPFVKEIVEISADADSLFAFDSEGRMYQMFTNDLGPGLPFVWLYAFGWPEKIQLVQNQNVLNKRAWASGARRQDVLWHEDIFGNPHHYGAMGIETIYFLQEDGQGIRFTDSGLPADFSRSILGPERGSFIAENLSASASTMFVINKAGTMYTRLADFDTLGCDPMFFKYTYEKLPQKYEGWQYLSNYSPWGLPSEPWLKQPNIPLEGKARLTKHITILQNGRGNDSRELRVAGLNKDGKTGYYSKQISLKNSTDWHFVPVELYFSEESFLPVTVEGIPKEIQDNLYGEKQEFSYVGKIWKNGTEIQGVKCSIPDLPLSEGQCTLEISYKDEVKKIIVHPVEIWSYMFRNNPGFDGTSKNFFITFEFQEDVLNSQYPEFSNLLKDIFAKKNKVLFSSLAIGTDKFFRIKVTDTKYISGTEESINIASLPQLKKNEFTFFLVNKDVVLDEDTSVNFFYFEQPSLLQYNSATLQIKSGTTFTIENRDVLDRAIVENQKYKEMLKKELAIYKKYASKAKISRWGYGVADLFTTVTLLNQINYPKIKNITSYGDVIMEQNAKKYESFSKTSSWLYAHLIELLDLRIDVYKKIQQEVSKNNYAKIPINLKDNFVDYYVYDGEIPLNISGRSQFSKNTDALMKLLPDSPSFPGFIIELQDNSFILVELQNSAKELFNLYGKPKEDWNLRLDLIYYVFNTSDVLAEDVSLTKGKKGRFYWNGKSIKVIGKESFFTEKILFEANLE